MSDDLLTQIWHENCPGTPEEFARFCGVSCDALNRSTWEILTHIADERFQMFSLGGSLKYAGTPLREFLFKFQCPRESLFWRTGVPHPGGWIGRANDANTCFIGHGKTLDIAALSALLVLWEFTYRRAMTSEKKA